MKVPGGNVNRQERTLECAVSRKYQARALNRDHLNL